MLVSLIIDREAAICSPAPPRFPFDPCRELHSQNIFQPSRSFLCIFLKQYTLYTYMQCQFMYLYKLYVYACIGKLSNGSFTQFSLEEREGKPPFCNANNRKISFAFFATTLS